MIHPNNPLNQVKISTFEKMHHQHTLITVDLDEIRNEYQSIKNNDTNGQEELNSHVWLNPVSLLKIQKKYYRYSFKELKEGIIISGTFFPSPISKYFPFPVFTNIALNPTLKAPSISDS